MCKSIGKIFGLGGGSSGGSSITTWGKTTPAAPVTPPPTTAPTGGNGNGTAPATPTKDAPGAQQNVATEQDDLSYGLNGLGSLLGLIRGRGAQRGASTNVGTLGVKLGQ